MTISMYEAYMQRMQLHRTERIMDMSEATLFAQMTTDARRKVWSGWMMLVHHINMIMIHGDALNHGENPITWNGRKMSIKGLIKQFGVFWGKGSVG